MLPVKIPEFLPVTISSTPWSYLHNYNVQPFTPTPTHFPITVIFPGKTWTTLGKKPIPKVLHTKCTSRKSKKQQLWTFAAFWGFPVEIHKLNGIQLDAEFNESTGRCDHMDYKPTLRILRVIDRGWGQGKVQILPFSIHLSYRPYNTASLPCECVMTTASIAQLNIFHDMSPIINIQ